MEYLAGGHLTEVSAPTPGQEAARDLSRAREDAQQDRMRCRHRLAKFLLRRGMNYAPGRKSWTEAHRAWLQKLCFEDPVEQAVFDDYRLAVVQLDARIEALDRRLEALAREPGYRSAVGALRCFRGIDTRTALGLVTELHSIEHFDRAGGLMAFVGLVPSEASSGDRQRRGAITKAGNGHARKLLIEAAWHARHNPAIPVGLRQRRAGQSPEVIALADIANMLPGMLGYLIGIPTALAVHLLNIGIGIASPTIHSLRLNFVEFLPKFYTPEGKGFSPFRKETQW